MRTRIHKWRHTRVCSIQDLFYLINILCLNISDDSKKCFVENENKTYEHGEKFTIPGQCSRSYCYNGSIMHRRFVI